MPRARVSSSAIIVSIRRGWFVVQEGGMDDRDKAESQLAYLVLLLNSTAPAEGFLESRAPAGVATGDLLHEIVNWTAPAAHAGNGSSRRTDVDWYESGKIQIPLYCVIFMLAITGNCLVILTLVQNKRMRTITNLFLLNLAVSDLLLGVLCMPFTLVGALLRDFIFGELMCKLLPYLQACSVAVGVWTLVAISVERYYAICHPLRSLRWQTAKHAYKTIGTIWLGSFVCMCPIGLLSQLQPTNQGHHKCRENWPSLQIEKGYNILLDVVLLVVPLLVLAVTYSLITRTLWKGIRREKSFKAREGKDLRHTFSNRRRSNKWDYSVQHDSSESRKLGSLSSTNISSFNDGSCYSGRPGKCLRRTNAEKSLINKKRVIKMLFAVVLEFFICWTPLYIINTVALFEPSMVYSSVGYTGISFFQLLAYTSSCCNPITYCFMNCGFRRSFLNMFRCMNKFRETGAFVLHTSEFNVDLKCAGNRNVDQATRSPLL